MDIELDPAELYATGLKLGRSDGDRRHVAYWITVRELAQRNRSETDGDGLQSGTPEALKTIRAAFGELMREEGSGILASDFLFSQLSVLTLYVWGSGDLWPFDRFVDGLEFGADEHRRN